MTNICMALNTVTGERYIGRITDDINARWRRHCQDSNSCPALHKAIIEYGSRNFNLYLIERVDDNRAVEREQFWIDQFAACERGYNRASVGKDFHKRYPAQGQFDIMQYIALNKGEILEDGHIYRKRGAGMLQFSDYFVKIFNFICIINEIMHEKGVKNKVYCYDLVAKTYEQFDNLQKAAQFIQEKIENPPNLRSISSFLSECARPQAIRLWIYMVICGAGSYASNYR